MHVAREGIFKRLQIAASAKQTPSQMRIIAPLATRHLRKTTCLAA